MRILTRVPQIPRRCPMKRLVDQQADLELDSKGNWEPVQNITKERCNMVVFSPIAQQPSSGIEGRLQAIQEILRCSNQQTVLSIVSVEVGLIKRNHSVSRFEVGIDENNDLLKQKLDV